MKITWPPGDLENVCASSKMLHHRFAENDATVKQILTVLGQADTMQDVRRFRFLQLFLLPPTGKRAGGLLIRHKEIDVTATLLGDDNNPIRRADTESADWLNEIRRLHITNISDNT